MMVPKIDNSDREERLAYVREKYKCRVDCDMCGNCKVLRGRDAEDVFADYIEGKTEYVKIASQMWK